MARWPRAEGLPRRITTSDAGQRPSAIRPSAKGQLCLLLIIVALFPAGSAGSQATPYVPNDDIAYHYIDALMARGLFRGLPAMERPYHAGRLRAALDSARAEPHGRVTASYMDALSESLQRFELRRASDTSARIPFRAKATFDIYTTAQTSSHRDLMRADWNEDIEPAAAGYFVMGGGHLAGAVRAILDPRLNEDPEFSSKKDRAIAGRTEDAYLAGQWKYAEAAYGRVARSWGPHAFSGLLLGDDAYTYDHLYARVGTERIHISTVIAKLENYILAPGFESSRYFSVHRLAFNRGAWELGLSEAYLYTGVGRGLEFSLLNPLNVYGLSWKNERTDGNLSFGGDFAWKSRRFGVWSAQVLLDDIQIDRCDTVCAEPSSYGLTFSAEGIPLAGEQRGFASYTRVSNLAYRTPNVSERYSSYLVGLGRGSSDYDEVRVGLDLALVPRTPLKLYLAKRRQGQGDYRAPFPPLSEYGTTAGFLSGNVWTVSRIGASGAAVIGRDFQLTADAGVNWNRNRFNVVGQDDKQFEGRLKATWVPRWLIRFD